jgi:protein-tyrosine phosphatase
VPNQFPSGPPSRVLNFAGGCNFRDIGGYRTESAQTVHWGKVYRTGVLSYFTPDDAAHLIKLNVRTICELRRAEERVREPTKWPDTTTVHLNWEDGPAPVQIRDFAARHPSNGVGMHAAMIDFYRALPSWMAPRLGAIFSQVAQDRAPLIVHCAAGKDRTGIAIALLLALLGVPEETIVADYLLTNEAGDLVQFALTNHQAQLGIAMNQHPLLTMPEDVRKVIFSAHADYLHAALEQINRDHGNAERFLEAKAGVNAPMRQRIREVLLK